MFAEYLEADPSLKNEKSGTEGRSFSVFDPLSNFKAKQDNEGHHGVLQHLIGPNIKDENGDTALHRASSMGELEDVKRLIADEANPNLKNKKGETTLHKASRSGKLEVVMHLIANGADPELQDNNGKTAYDHAKERSVCGDSWREKRGTNVMNYLQTLPQN